MRQRVLQATLITVALAVVMLGTPLGWTWLQLTRQQLASDANLILDQVRIDTDQRLTASDTFDPSVLQQHVDAQSDLEVTIVVTLQDETVQAGDPVGRDPISVSTIGARGQSITVHIPESEVRAHTASAWVLIVVAGLAALSIGVSVALWQAQRISMPLARLNRRAEEMGAGRARSAEARAR